MIGRVRVDRKSDFCLLPFAVCLLLLASPAAALNPTAHFPITASVSPSLVAVGGKSTLTVTLTVPAPYHVNASRPSFDYLVPTSLDVRLPSEISAGAARFPAAQSRAVGGIDTAMAVYGGVVAIRVPLAFSTNTAPGSRTITGTLHYQACDEASCYPPVALTFATDLMVQADTVLAVALVPTVAPDTMGEPDTTSAPTSSVATTPLDVLTRPVPLTLSEADFSHVTQIFGLAGMLLFAFLGGLLLNLMPCVLPVLSLKILSFVKQSQESRGRAAALGIAYTLGVLASFWILVGVVIILRHAGLEVGWGFQFQNPYFVSSMTAIVTVFSLNLFGVFELNLPGESGANLASLSSREGLGGALLSGAFATVLATPCTAPFLGAAMGFAFTQPALILAAAFTAAGVGLALPYLILSLVPAARRFLPRPGMWMERLKQVFGFLLLATLLWLWFILGRSSGMEALLGVAAWNLVIAFTVWAASAAGGLRASATRRGVIRLIALVVIALSYLAILHPILASPLPHVAHQVEDNWQPYTENKLADLRAEGRIIFVDVTADWCLTCKVNEATVLETTRLQTAFTRYRVATLRADWTRQDASVSDFLKRFGRAGVPFYVIFPGSAAPIILPEFLTAERVEDALAEADRSAHSEKL